MPEDVMFQEAVQAARQGQRIRARDLLTRLLRADQANPKYWIWLSAVVDTRKEQVYCLQTALKLDPNDPEARKGLILLGAMEPGPDLAPVPPVNRHWEIPLEQSPRPTGLRAVWANPVLRGIFLGVLSVAILGLIAAGIFGFRFGKLPVAFFPTKTPGPSPTFTTTPTTIPRTRVVVTATPIPPTFAVPTPLWMLLKATYTPTPMYVNTPHAISEAYRAALRGARERLGVGTPTAAGQPDRGRRRPRQRARRGGRPPQPGAGRRSRARAGGGGVPRLAPPEAGAGEGGHGGGGVPGAPPPL